MEAKKEEMPPAYANDTPDLHDEKPTGAIVQEEAVHSVALTEALAAGPKPSIWSKSMLQLYAIMAVGYLVSTLNGYDSSLMGYAAHMHEPDSKERDSIASINSK